MLAGGGGAVVTGGTETHRIHTRVIEAGVAPVVGRVMTGIALLGGLDMGRVLPGCPHPVVAGRADTGGLEAVVVETDHVPICRGGMTEVAGLVGDDMGRVLSRGLNPVVTGGAGTGHHLAVIEAYLVPRLGGGVAAVALGGGLNMLRMLARLGDAVMAG